MRLCSGVFDGVILRTVVCCGKTRRMPLAGSVGRNLDSGRIQYAFHPQKVYDFTGISRSVSKYSEAALRKSQ